MTTMEHLMAVAVKPPVCFTRGEGAWLYDEQGRRYLDFVQGWAVNALGHCPPVVVNAIRRQAERLMSPGPGYHNDRAPRLARLLAEQSGLDRLFFANSGAEANEGAIKLARKWGALRRGGAYGIITMENGFHGRTLATMSATGKAAWEPLFAPKVPGFTKVPFNDLDAVAAAMDANTVAVMVEPLQGEGGVVPAAPGYLEGLRELTHERGVLLILDEVQTGVGRTGTLFAFQRAGILPDILTLGKGLGGGFPLAALAAREEFCCFEPGDQGGTFNGNPLAAAAGLAVLESVTALGFLERVKARGAQLRARLETLSRRYGHLGVRGEGLLLGMVLARPVASRVAELALERGLLINAPRPEVLRFMPALNVSEAEVEQMVALLEPLLGSDAGRAG